IKYTQVQGSGLTIADALNEINAKTGFFPKLQFCKLILMGESCRERELFGLLACFYRKNFSELTALIAACEGKASDMLALKSETSDMTSEAINKVLSDEIAKSANATPMNLKDIAVLNYSKSSACYLPYVEANKVGTSENGGNGENIGGEGGNQGSQGGSQGGSGGGSGGGESGGSQGGEGGGGQQGGGSKPEEPMEFTARRTAIYSDGMFKGILDEQQAFALAALKNDIHLAVLPCDADDIHYTLGMKSVSGGVDFKVNSGVPELTVKFKAKAKINGARKKLDPHQIIFDDVVSGEVLKGAEEELKNRFTDLIETSKETDCDILGIKELLYKKEYKYFDAFKDDVLTRMEVKFDIEVGSAN
ncbi:MAG: hypothetical protein K2K38_05870, partial [Clostridia bacterium]|nr:hypothetical protein [Clostridia bacterium]